MVDSYCNDFEKVRKNQQTVTSEAHNSVKNAEDNVFGWASTSGGGHPHEASHH